MSNDLIFKIKNNCKSILKSLLALIYLIEAVLIKIFLI